MFCHKCGTKLPDDAEYCYSCGTKVVYDATDPKRVDIIVPDNEQQQTERTTSFSGPLIDKINLLTRVAPEHEARVVESVQDLTGLGPEGTRALVKKSPALLEITPMTLAQVKDVKEAFIQAGVNACFLDRYGNIVDTAIPDKDTNGLRKDTDRLRCPKCHSSDLIPITETTTDVSGGGYGVGKGCCGWILFGPLGLLCGLCGSGVKTNTKTSTSWVCKNCGHKFQNPLDSESKLSLDGIFKILIISILLVIIGLVWAFISVDYGETYLWILPLCFGGMGVPISVLMFLLQWFLGSKEEKDEFIKKYRLRMEKIKSKFGAKK